MQQFFSFIRKEFYHVFRDPKTLLMLFGMPIALIVLFGFALTNEIKNSKIVICDLAKDPASQRIIEKIEVSKNFEVRRYAADIKQADEYFKEVGIKLVVIFPNNFSDDLLHLNKAQIQILADASDPNTATTLTNYVNNIIRDYQQEVVSTNQMPLRIATSVRMIYNPELKGTTNFVPGVMALVLLLVGVLMTSVSIVREKELGTMEILLVSPINPLFVVISKAVPYLFLSMINLAVVLLLSVFLLGMPFKGSLLLLIFESALLILTALSLGLLISNSTNSQQQAMLLSLMGMLLPVMLFSGFLFPLENMPKPLQIFSHIVPSRWYYVIVKSIMIKGLGLAAIWKETLILMGMTVFLLSLSIRKFKIRLG